jgi:hypothetical protein
MLKLIAEMHRTDSGDVWGALAGIRIRLWEPPHIGVVDAWCQVEGNIDLLCMPLTVRRPVQATAGLAFRLCALLENVPELKHPPPPYWFDLILTTFCSAKVRDGALFIIPMWSWT